MRVPPRKTCLALICISYVTYFVVYAVNLGLLQHVWTVASGGGKVECSEQNIFVSRQSDPAESHLTFPQPSLLRHCLASANPDQLPPAASPSAVRTRCHTRTPELLSFRDSKPIRSHRDLTTIPNVVHYVIFADVYHFTLLNYLSCISAHLFIQPTAIFIHGDVIPQGRWWEQTIEQVPNVYHVFIPRPLTIQGWKLGFIEHASDITRLEILYRMVVDNGGIYLDLDVLVLRSFTPLLNYTVVLGRETSTTLGNNVILAAAKAPFLCLWRQLYGDYSPWPWNWARFSTWEPHTLATLLPPHIGPHVESDAFQRPNYYQLDSMFHGHFNWSSSYAMHVWHRWGSVPESLEQMNSADNTLGDVMKYVYHVAVAQNTIT